MAEAVVLVATFIVAVTGVDAVTTTLLLEPKEHVGSTLTPLGAEAMAHFRFTCPVKPPAGVRVMVEVPVDPRLATVTDVPVRVKPAGTTGALMVTVTLVVATEAPPAFAVTDSV